MKQDGASREVSAGGLGKVRFAALTALFALSGGAGLVDQVCFSKYLSYLVGSTAYAVSAVLAAFMTGLALGAGVAGRLSLRIRRHVAAYGVAEVAVGLMVAFGPMAFAAITPAYTALAARLQGSLAALSVARWLVAFVVVVVPTVGMGATLPLLAPVLGADDQDLRHRRLGTLYAANTFGGALGALGAAYVILPALGLSRTLFAAAAVSGAVGIAAIWMGRRLEVAETRMDVEVDRERLSETNVTEGYAIMMAIAGLSGFLVFAAEVVSTHLLAVIIGNSAYAFGLILSIFLVCLFAGALLAPRALRRFGAAALPLSLAGASVVLAATLPAWDKSPLAFGGLGEYITTFEGREAMRAVVAFGILVLPVTLMGITFPLLLQRAADHRLVGLLVGRLTAVNTIGAVLGALATGYVLLPRLGSQGCLRFVAVAFAAAGVATLSGVAAGLQRRITWGLAVLGAAAAVVVPTWNPLTITAGTNVYFDSGGKPERVLFMRDDVHGGITTVAIKDDVRTLYTNGKFQGNTGWEMNAQRYFAHYPCLFVPHFDSVLVIGLGTGTTLGTLAAYPWKRLELVEISPAIIEASSSFFEKSNKGALRDPRLVVHVDDARNWLLVHDARFDLISIELSSIWFAGASSLYSREFYALIHKRLGAGGILQQWVQLHHVYAPVLATMVNTLRAEFPNVALFLGGGQGILIAGDAPLRWSVARARALTPRVADMLPGGRSLDELTDDILLVGDGLDRYIESVASQEHVDRRDMVSTDDNLYLEYETPRGNVLPWIAREELVAKMRRFRDPIAVASLADTAPETPMPPIAPSGLKVMPAAGAAGADAQPSH